VVRRLEGPWCDDVEWCDEVDEVVGGEGTKVIVTLVAGPYVVWKALKSPVMTNKPWQRIGIEGALCPLVLIQVGVTTPWESMVKMALSASSVTPMASSYALPTCLGAEPAEVPAVDAKKTKLSLLAARSFSGSVFVSSGTTAPK